MVQRFCAAYEHSKMCSFANAGTYSSCLQAKKRCRAKLALDDRHTRLRNLAHPCAPARGPCRSPGTASTTAEQRAPVEAPTGKVVWGSHIIAGALGRDRSAASGATTPRAGAAEGRAGAAEGQRAAIAAPLGFATASRIDAARRRQHKAKGQPTAHTQDPHDTLRANKAARRWPAATRPRAAAA